MLKLILIIFISKVLSMVLANANPDHITVCNGLTCKLNEQCVMRKFWCDYTVCPQMIFCSESQLDSLRGPETCESVLCPDGYGCVLRVRECTWNHGCKQHLARCISNVELADEPTTCANVHCGRGHQCILRESRYCLRPPCRLTKSCAYSEDVEKWFAKCKQLGCRSELECFLRRPPEKCATSSCKHIPDCLIPPDTFESTSSKLCHGWICPASQVCSARLQASCSFPGLNCPVLRSCDYHLPDLTQHANPRTTLTDIERDIFLEEQRRMQRYQQPLFHPNVTQTEIQQYYNHVLPSGQSRKNPHDTASFSIKSKRVSVSPITRSTSQHGDSAWLNYLKRRAGVETVQYWIDKAKSNQDYEGFLEWLDTVSELLDPDTYRLWLMEVELASANVPEFQAWISPRNLAAHRLAAVSTTQKTLPVLIADKAKNLFYSDKSLMSTDQRQKAGSKGAIRQPSNFEFNEASQLGDGPLGQLEIPFQPQGPSDVGYGLPQDFEEAVKNSWKTWQSYYQSKQSSLSGFAGQVAGIYLSNNITKSRQNTSVPQFLFTGNRYATVLKRNDDMPAGSLATMVDKIEGLKTSQPNLASLDPNQLMSQLMLPSNPVNNEHLPNLLIYFPSPLNIFMYYSVGNHNDTDNGNTSLKRDDKINFNFKSKMGTRMFDGYGYIPQDYDDNPNFYNKTGPTGKQKEIEYIRKIIRELIDCWGDEEQSLDKFKKKSNAGVKRGHFNEKPSRITNIKSNETKPDETEGKPTFDTFVQWLFKHGHINSTYLSDVGSRNKQPPIYEELEKQNFRSSNSRNSESNKNSTSEKIRILVDIDKNSEIINKIFSKNSTNNKNDSNSQQYQVIVNLNEYIDSQEEDLISRRLINIASKQLHRNINENEKMPKVLWVFPVYEDEENETIINEIKKRRKDKVSTLEYVDAPTERSVNNDYNYSPNNTYSNSGNKSIDQVGNANNYDNLSIDDSKKDTEGEYYDDQDMYDEDHYDQSEINESIENESNPK